MGTEADARARLRTQLAKGEGKRRAPAPISPAIARALKPRERGHNPASVTADKAEAILDRMWDGRFLTAICRDDDMPGRRAVYRYLASHPEFHGDYGLARQALGDFFAEDALRIADDIDNDVIENENGSFPNPAAVMRAKLRVETRLRLAAMLNPGRYGRQPAEPQEHVHRHFIDRPPDETREQWIERRRRELGMPQVLNGSARLLGEG